jgi:hypothetical protein
MAKPVTGLGGSQFGSGPYLSSALGTQNAINVTVNGAIDAEGTARTIVNTLNDSFYRGTGGANAFALARS